MPNNAWCWFILPVCLVMLLCVGTGQAWSVYVKDE